jgi:hypothetical protein
MDGSSSSDAAKSAMVSVIVVGAYAEKVKTCRSQQHPASKTRY